MARLVPALVAAAVLAAAAPALAQEKLTVFWTRGLYKAEDDALRSAIARFEAASGVAVELVQYPAQEMIPKTAAALEAGNPPDVAFADYFDFQVTGKWAFEGKLADLSDILVPMKDAFLANTLETTNLRNDRFGRRAYYAFPVRQQTIHVEYWKDMLAEAGFRESDIPGTWKAYWDFWCGRLQPALRAKPGQRTYAIGHPMGVDSSDSYFSFLTFADAYNVRLVDDDGKLRLDDPRVRAGLIGALRDYTAVYARGCTPPESTSWKDPDNNAAFQDRTTVMTHNTTIAIAAKWADDAANEALPAEQRAQAKRNYDARIVTAGWPSKPDGTRMVYRAAVKTGVVFAEAKNRGRAKEFVAFLLRDENLGAYVEAARGRWFPVTKAGAASAFWQADPHRRAVYRQFAAGTVTFEFTRNPRFVQLDNDNVWAKAMHRVVKDHVPVETAVDELIARIRQAAGGPRGD